jgi:ribosomal protein S18
MARAPKELDSQERLEPDCIDEGGIQMTNDKMIQFVKRWREIERAQKDIDFTRSELARDIRAEFPRGDNGDQQFTNWCVNELGLTAFAVKELLLRAVAATVVPDERTYKMVGGFKAIRPMQDLTKSQQVIVLEAAKAQSKAPRTIMKERGLLQSMPVTPARVTPVLPAPVLDRTANHNAPKSEHERDAEVLARYIAKTGRDIPRDIMALIAKYSPSVVRRRAA